MRKSGFYVTIYVAPPGNEREIREVGLGLNGLLDTGAELSVIPESSLALIESQDQLPYKYVNFRGVNGNILQSKVVSLSVGIEFKGNFVILDNIEFFVLPTSKDLLIGLNIISRLTNPNAIETVSVQQISSNILRISISLPNLLPIEKYLGSFVSLLTSLSNLYQVFSLVYSSDSAAVSKFANEIQTQNNSLQTSALKINFEDLPVEPLRVISARYGSDASFDLLGLGKILEQLRETVKDIVWRGKHEKELSEVNLRRVEVETEKESVEIQAKLIQIDKEKIEAERALLEIAHRRLELIEKAANMELPDKERQLIISAIVPQLQVISISTTNLISSSSEVPLLPEGETSEDSNEDAPQ